MTQHAPDLIVHNGKLVTEDDRRSIAQAAAARSGKFVAVGTDREVLAIRGEQTAILAGAAAALQSFPCLPAPLQVPHCFGSPLPCPCWCAAE